MTRQKLLEILGIVRPALASNDFIPVLTHLWFENDRVLAYSDFIAISAPCEVGFTGAVRGAPLLGVLQASRAKEVEFTVAKDSVRVRAAGSRLNLPLLAVEKFPFEMPDPGKRAEKLPVSSSEFITGIERCLPSTSKDPSVPDQLGVTIIPGKKNLLLYATNGATMAHVPVAYKTETSRLTRRVILPALFCEQLIRLARQDKGAKLMVAEDYAFLETSGGVQLYSKLVMVDHPLDFGALFREVCPRDESKQSIKMPKGLARAIDRALVIADPSGERVRTQISVAKGVASFLTKSGVGRGEITDRIKFTSHPDVKVSVDAQWFKLGAGFDKILVTEKAVIMRKGRGLYLVAPSN